MQCPLNVNSDSDSSDNNNNKLRTVDKFLPLIVEFVNFFLM